MAAYQRQVRQAQRLQEIQAVMDLDRELIALCHAHQQDFSGSQRPMADAPEPVIHAEIKRRLKRDATAGIGPLKLAERRAAKRSAVARLEEEIRAEADRRAQEARETQAQLDEQWARLQANDSAVVLLALEAAFQDNEMPAAAVSCREARVDIVIRWPNLDDIVPERKASVTPSGQPTIRKRNKTERAELYLEALCSHALVTAKEAFAVCPGIAEAGLAVVRAGRNPARGDEVLEPLLLATVNRERLEGILWGNIVGTAALLENATGKIGMRGKGANKTLFALDLSKDTDERTFVSQVADGLGARVPDSGVSGLALPVEVVVNPG